MAGPGGYDLTNDEEVKAYLQNIETEYSYQCLSEKEPDGCHRLAQFVYNIKRDEAAGCELFKKNCDEYKYGPSCHNYAGQRSLGKGTEADKKDGAKYFEKACEYGYPRGCANAGFLYLEGDAGMKDYDKGLRYMSKACESEEGPACSALGAGYLQSKYGLERNIDKATLLLNKGCDLGSMYGCINLSMMYKTGDGVPRNDALAHKYKTKAAEIQGAKDSKQQPGIAFGKTS